MGLLLTASLLGLAAPTAQGLQPQAQTATGDEGFSVGEFPNNVDAPVLAITAFGGDLYVGGRLGDGVSLGLLRWDGATWQPVGTGIFSWTSVAQVRAVEDHLAKIDGQWRIVNVLWEPTD